MERRRDAHGLLIVQFTEVGRVVRELHILRDRDGEPLTVGHGRIDVFAREPNSPEYRYRRGDVAVLRDWLLAQLPDNDAGARRPPARRTR